MTQHTEPVPSRPQIQPLPQVTLRTPADLAEALPYLIGFHPDRSIVMIALQGPRSRVGARLRAALPQDPAQWRQTAALLADRLVLGGGGQQPPDGIALFLCEEPRPGESAAQAMERLRPLAQQLRTACGALDVPVLEALCICAGRWWSYCCPGTGCCPPEGTALRGGTSVLAAAAAYAGFRVRGSLREMQARCAPLTGVEADLQERALDEASAELVPRMLDGSACPTVREETIALARAALERFRTTRGMTDDAAGDCRDDALLSGEEAAAILLGLQDRIARDRAAEWMEGPDAMPALRLWRALARRCVGVYRSHAAAPITLAGWVCWSLGDEPAARVALEQALDIDPGYTFADLLHQACSHGLDPEPLRRSLRAERRKHRKRAARPRAGSAPKGRPQAGARPAAAGVRFRANGVRSQANRAAAPPGAPTAAPPGRDLPAAPPPGDCCSPVRGGPGTAAGPADDPYSAPDATAEGAP